MTTVSQIITDAYRQSNLIAVGTLPSAAQQDEALRYLNRIVRSTLGNEVGEPLEAFPVGSVNISRPSGYPWYHNTPDGNWFLPENKRMMSNVDRSTTIYLHPKPNDGARLGLIDIAGNLSTYPMTISGNGRTIEGQQSITISTDSVDYEWFYDDTTGNWARTLPLDDLNGTFPFPEDFDIYFICLLAAAINPAYEVQADAQLAMHFNRARSQIRARYHNVIPVGAEDGLVRMPRVALDRDMWGNRWQYYDPNYAFTFGVPW